MTCVAMGLLLRVSYELKRAERRQAVRIGGAEDAASEPVDAPAAPMATGVPLSAAPVAPRLLQRTPRAAPAACSRASNRPSGGCHERGHR